MELIQELAVLLHTTEEKVGPRILGMGLGETCRRCGGSGRYSYNQIDGDRCFGCGGLGQVVPPKARMRACLERAATAVAAGQLDTYLDNLRAKARCKNMEAKLQAMWGFCFEGSNEYVWHQAQQRYGDGADRRRCPKYTRRDGGLAWINRLAHDTVVGFDKFSARFKRLRTRKNWKAYELVYASAAERLVRIHSLATRFSARHPRVK